VSLAHGQYYANRQNKFWSLVGNVIEQDLVGMDYPARLDGLLKHHIGLWDVVAQALRVGSLDSNIREHASNDLLELVGSLPNLAAIAFNGGTAAKLGIRALGQDVGKIQLITLPSSSPAHTLAYAQKLSAWQALRSWLPQR